MKLLPISKSEAARYMGIRGEPDSAAAEIIDRYEELVRERMSPRYVYRLFDITEKLEGVCIPAAELLLTGESIRRHLSGCRSVVLLAATLSAEADKLIRQAQVDGMAEALAADALCSAAIEQVCNRAEEEIFSQVEAPFRTWRFSPGYGDLPIDVQQGFAAALNAQRRIALTVTESCLLVPTKSVTAIIGISDTPPAHTGHGCAACNMRDRCAFSHSGGCGKK